MGLGLSGDIVMRLLDCVPKFENHKVAFDNWFNSYALQCRSYFSGIQCIGTVRQTEQETASLQVMEV